MGSHWLSSALIFSLSSHFAGLGFSVVDDLVVALVVDLVVGLGVGLVVGFGVGLGVVIGPECDHSV